MDMRKPKAGETSVMVQGDSMKAKFLTTSWQVLMTLLESTFLFLDVRLPIFGFSQSLFGMINMISFHHGVPVSWTCKDQICGGFGFSDQANVAGQ